MIAWPTSSSGEAVRVQREGPGEVGAVGPEPAQRERLDLGLAGQVDLQRALGEQLEAVGLERREVRLERGDAPELRGLREAVAHLQHEPARRRADGAELDDRQLAGEGQDERVAGGVDLEDDFGLEVEQRLVETPGTCSRMPPDSSMKNDVPRVMSLNEPVPAAESLPAESLQLPATNVTLTVPAVSGAGVDVAERRRRRPGGPTRTRVPRCRRR